MADVRRYGPYGPTPPQTRVSRKALHSANTNETPDTQISMNVVSKRWGERGQHAFRFRSKNTVRSKNEIVRRDTAQCVIHNTVPAFVAAAVLDNGPDADMYYQEVAGAAAKEAAAGGARLGLAVQVRRAVRSK